MTSAIDPFSQFTVETDASNQNKSLLSTSTNAKTHDRLFGFKRRLRNLNDIPSWLTSDVSVWVKSERAGKYDNKSNLTIIAQPNEVRKDVCVHLGICILVQHEQRVYNVFLACKSASKYGLNQKNASCTSKWTKTIITDMFFESCVEIDRCNSIMTPVNEWTKKEDPSLEQSAKMLTENPLEILRLHRARIRPDYVFYYYLHESSDRDD
ncbi:hypothetical protein GJ496_007276 [Pomphorhynchus laevis]|nr:hypothetical protein GJ496_007276 [Pomphorhynchus laevis]